jgi:integrase/recombinase XerC
MLMFGQGLRRNEVAQLDLSDLDARGSRLQILGKGRRETEWVTLSAPTLATLRAWVTKRGRSPGPLFQSLTLRGALSGRRLDGDGMHYLLQRWGKDLGMVLRPHGLRHTFVNVALEATSGNLHAVRKAARWRKLDTVIAYDDNRTDVAGDVARKVGARVADVVEDAAAKAAETTHDTH